MPRLTHLLLVAACAVASGCATVRTPRFVDVPTPIYGEEIALILADEEKVTLRVSKPNELVFLAEIEPRVIDEALYLFPVYIAQPTRSTVLQVPVEELDLPPGWREHVFWVESQQTPPWYRRVWPWPPANTLVERRRLELPESPADPA